MTDTTERELQARLKAYRLRPDANEHDCLDMIESLRTVIANDALFKKAYYDRAVKAEEQLLAIQNQIDDVVIPDDYDIRACDNAEVVLDLFAQDLQDILDD